MNIVSRLVFAITILISMLAGDLHAGTFEGRITYSMHSAEMDRIVASSPIPVPPTGKMKSSLAVKGRNIRMDSPGMVMIFAWEKKEAISLMPAHKTYSVLPMNPDAHVSPTKNQKVIKTGKTAIILGYSCEEYTFTRPDGSEEVWITRDLGSWEGLGSDGLGIPAYDLGEEFKDAAGFALLTVARDGQGQEMFRMEATEVERASLPDSLFVIPSDYKPM